MSVSIAERKAVLDLFPYFDQKQPVVFDVGSNKGVWADILVHNVAEMHLFEPNEILLHYTMAKYDYLDNVFYHNEAVSNKVGEVEFFRYLKNYNGLSSLKDNPKWAGLPKEVISVSSIPLQIIPLNQIDFLKIDVEGAEMNVLMGAADFLARQIIKFVQVERAEHIKNYGWSFEDVEDFMKQCGYIQMQTEDTENVIFMQEGFTQDWNGEFKKNTAGMKFDFALEIGAFEGLTSRYICDNMLNPGGRMICIDPLTDEYLPGHEDNNLFVGQYERFTRNTRNYPIELIRKRSIDSFQQLSDYRFDFIYVDGDHRENEVFMDGCNSFRLCKIGGHILFDDYEWREETKRGIDKFIDAHAGKIQVVLKGYQVMVKKLDNL
jgi:FkbM family methyltransferase